MLRRFSSRVPMAVLFRQCSTIPATEKAVVGAAVSDSQEGNAQGASGPSTVVAHMRSPTHNYDSRRSKTPFEQEQEFNVREHYKFIARENKSLISFVTGMTLFYAAQPLTWPVNVGALSAFALWQRMLSRGPKNTLKADLAGKTVIVTGGSSGIGCVTAVALAKMNARVITTCRSDLSVAAVRLHNEVQAQVQSQEEQDAVHQRITMLPLDLSDYDSIRIFVSNVRDRLGMMKAADEATFGKTSADETGSEEPSGPGIDLLVNNAGGWFHQLSHTPTGEEMNLGANYMGAFYLTELLLKDLRRCGGRVINVSSAAHVAIPLESITDVHLAPRISENNPKHPFQPNKRYALSKLMNIYHADYLAEERGIQAASVHPGGVVTRLFREPMPSLFDNKAIKAFVTGMIFRTEHEGAQTLINACVREDLVAGGFYCDCALAKHGKSQAAIDESERKLAIEWTLKNIPPLE